MEIMSLAIAVFAVIIGLVIGYVSISAKMKSSQEAAELMLLNAEQEATNLRGQLSVKRIYLLMKPNVKASLLKKKHYWRPKKKPENTVKKWTLNSNQNVKNSNKSKVV